MSEIIRRGGVGSAPHDGDDETTCDRVSRSPGPERPADDSRVVGTLHKTPSAAGDKHDILNESRRSLTTARKSSTSPSPMRKPRDALDTTHSLRLPVRERGKQGACWTLSF